ncbi:MAG TPA: aminopeptidase, partial [archaeon]|nr:aminopeptidase [archaeon]
MECKHSISVVLFFLAGAQKLKLFEACKKIVKKTLHLRPIDSVLVITDAAHQDFYEQFCQASKEVDVHPSVFVLPESLRPVRKISNALRQMLLHTSVVVNVADFRLEESQFRTAVSQLARQHSGRVLNMPGLPVSAFSTDLFDANPTEIAARTGKLYNILTEVDEVEVTSASGTKVSFKPSPVLHENHGLEIQPGQAIELPGGEVSVQPDPLTLSGVIVVDGVLAGKGVLKSPVRVHVEKGEVSSFKGKDAEFLEGVFAEDSNARRVSEFGLGTNHAAKVCDVSYLAEKTLGTCHFALGSSALIGGDVISGYHIGMLLKSPTVKFDGRDVIKNGKFL